jgi:hypothetical protein
MGRRKGELTSAGVDREYPHQVILPASFCASGNYEIVTSFCRDLSLAPRGHSVVKNDEWHHVFCFSVREDAEKMMARCGGEWFDLQTRGRGARWHLLRDARKRY